jgi:peptide-methionine (S)-S-oxide reductase
MIEGVIRTRVGYAGGLMENPNYGNIGDHTEAVQIDYDPHRTRYAELLEIFWKSHKPTSQAWSRQYMNAVFVHDEQQQTLAQASKTALAKKLNKPVRTKIVPLQSFTLAEDYHQKYLLKSRSDLAREMSRIYPRKTDFINSTAAARLNGYAGGHGTKDQLDREIDSLGLSPEGRRHLEDLVQGKGLFN